MALVMLCVQYDDQLNDIVDIVSSIENDVGGTSQSSTSYLVTLFHMSSLNVRESINPFLLHMYSVVDAHVVESRLLHLLSQIGTRPY